MEQATAFRLVLVTAGSRENALAIARHVVDHRLAACVNVIPNVQSVYRWEGKTTEEAECLLVMKTVEERLPEIESAVRKLHTYELPEVISVPVGEGSHAYLRWLADETAAERS